MAVADKRSHIKCGGSTSYRDDFQKLVTTSDYLIFNHGYNRIDDCDWKLKADQLTPDVTNPIYGRILNEMASKADKKAFYVFMNMKELKEIVLEVGKPIALQDHMPDDRLVCGDGRPFVDLKLLTDLHSKTCGAVLKSLEATFSLAYQRQVLQGGMAFSKDFQVMRK
jgi:hypothetical protein